MTVISSCPCTCWCYNRTILFSVLFGRLHGSKTPVNNLNKDFEKAEWKALWQRINRKAVYAVDFDSDELIAKCVKVFNSSEGFKVQKLTYTVQQAEQKATMVIEHLTYEPLQESYDTSIFTVGNRTDQSKVLAVCNHIYDYVYADSNNELIFAKDLDTSKEVVVYGKLPGRFVIPTPVGDYNPDWAISFKQGTVKHIYFVAETKGSLFSLQLRDIEKAKIACAKKFFETISTSEVTYDVVDTYGKLLELVMSP